MPSEEAIRRNTNHRRNMRHLAAMVVEHALRFLPQQDETRKTIEEDIGIVRSQDQGAIERRYKIAKRRKSSYTPAGQLLVAAEQMLFVAKHHAPFASLVDPGLTTYTAEAGYLVTEREIARTHDWLGKSTVSEQRAEYDWQNQVISPLLRKIYERYGTVDFDDLVRQEAHNADLRATAAQLPRQQ